MMTHKRTSVCVTALSIALLSALPLMQAGTIFEHTFDGGATDLNGTAVDVGGQNWVTAGNGGNINQDGSIDTNTLDAQALLPYSFGSDIYEVTLSVDHTSYDNSTTSLAGIYFTTSDPLTPNFILQGNAEAYGTFALRRDGTFEMWGGVGVTAGNDGGSLTDYGFNDTDDRKGTLRLVLDTTVANWTIAGYYTPDGKTEAQIDVNGAATGSVYTYSTNQPAGSFTGVGIMNSSYTTDYVDFSLSTIPEPSSLLLMGLFAGAFIVCRKKCRR